MINKLCFRSQQAIPEFLSTHPSDVTRINQIEAWIPEALKYYHRLGKIAGIPDRSNPALPAASGAHARDAYCRLDNLFQEVNRATTNRHPAPFF